MIERVKTMVEDDRLIKTVIFTNDEYLEVGAHGVTAIKVYEENGQMAPVPFVAIFKGSEIVRRIPAQVIEIVYDEDFFEVPQ